MNSTEVSSLLQLTLWKVVGSFNEYNGEVNNLPVSLKTRLSDVMAKRGLITDANISLLLSEEVRCLDLSHSEVTDLALFEVAKFCPYLVKIDLNSHKQPRLGISSTGISQLASRCKFIRSIYLRHCVEITDSGIENLIESCKNLTELNLGKCPLISDCSLKAISQHCAKLVSLNLSGTNITDDGIHKMVSGSCSQTLKEVHIDNCVQVTDSSVSSLISFCSNLSVLIFHNCPKITEQSRLDLENMQSERRVHVTFTVY